MTERTETTTDATADPAADATADATETGPRTETPTDPEPATTTETMTDANRDDATEANRNRTQKRDPDYRPTLGDVSHTNPYTNQVFGETQTYGRGKIVAADGGAADAVDERPMDDRAADGGRDAERNDGRDAEGDTEQDDERNVDEDTLGDVDHTPAAEEVDGTQGTFDRGREGNDEPADE